MVVVKERRTAAKATIEFWLNESQAILICHFEGNHTASALARKQIIESFLGFRHAISTSGPLPEPEGTDDAWAKAKDRVKTTRQILNLAADFSPEERSLHASNLSIWGGKIQRRPSWWGDLEVRAAVISIHRQTTIDGALAFLERRFGKARCPSRSSIGRFWKKYDGQWGEN